MKTEKIFDLPPLRVRNYSPVTDEVSVQANLRASGHYVDSQDNPERLAGLVNRLPSSILVVAAQDPALHGPEIFGNAYVPDCTYPLIGRLSLSALIVRPEDRFEVAITLYNGIFNELRERGADYAEELLDIPEQDVMAHREDFLIGLGFVRAGWSMRSMKYELWNEHGQPMPDIAPLNPRGDSRSLDVLALSQSNN